MPLYDEKKREEDLRKFMEAFQLEEIDEQDKVIVEQIARGMIADEKYPSTTPRNVLDYWKRTVLRILILSVEQNWLIIRQLSKLNKNIEKLTTQK